MKDLDKRIAEAVSTVIQGKAKRVDVTTGICVYRVSSPNPQKYTVRVDIKIEEGTVK